MADPDQPIGYAGDPSHITHTGATLGGNHSESNLPPFALGHGDNLSSMSSRHPSLTASRPTVTSNNPTPEGTPTEDVQTGVNMTGMVKTLPSVDDSPAPAPARSLKDELRARSIDLQARLAAKREAMARAEEEKEIAEREKADHEAAQKAQYSTPILRSDQSRVAPDVTYVASLLDPVIPRVEAM